MGTVSVRKLSRKAHRSRIHLRMRKKLAGTTERPRLCVYRSLKHMHAQIIDDLLGKTLVAASSLDEGVRAHIKGGGNIAASKVVGKIIAERALAAGLDGVAVGGEFDDGGQGHRFLRTQAISHQGEQTFH